MVKENIYEISPLQSIERLQKSKSPDIAKIECLINNIAHYFLNKHDETQNDVYSDIAIRFSELQNELLSSTLGKEYETYSRNRAIGTFIKGLVDCGSSANSAHTAVAVWLSLSIPHVKSCHHKYSLNVRCTVEPNAAAKSCASISYAFVYKHLSNYFDVEFPDVPTKKPYRAVKDAYQDYVSALKGIASGKAYQAIWTNEMFWPFPEKGKLR